MTSRERLSTQLYLNPNKVPGTTSTMGLDPDSSTMRNMRSLDELNTVNLRIRIWLLYLFLASYNYIGAGEVGYEPLSFNLFLLLQSLIRRKFLLPYRNMRNGQS